MSTRPIRSGIPGLSPVMTCRLTVLACFAVIALLLRPDLAAAWPRMTSSGDGTAISYEVSGSGEPTLVFVHGWSCDGRYWRSQVAHFSADHRVIVVDLAGHGHSGQSRSDYSMQRFGEDIRAVVDAEKVERAVLIGHSMGGSVIAEAARLMPDRVVGLIGVDTLENIEHPMTREEAAAMLAPFKDDFPAATRQFVGQMILASCPAPLKNWIIGDMAAAPPEVALSALQNLIEQYLTGDAARIFEQITVPVVSVNGDLWPIDFDANRRHMRSYEAVVLKSADHFLMMNRADEFNAALRQALDMIGTP